MTLQNAVNTLAKWLSEWVSVHVIEWNERAKSDVNEHIRGVNKRNWNQNKNPRGNDNNETEIESQGWLLRRRLNDAACVYTDPVPKIQSTVNWEFFFLMRIHSYVIDVAWFISMFHARTVHTLITNARMYSTLRC